MEESLPREHGRTKDEDQDRRRYLLWLLVGLLVFLILFGCGEIARLMVPDRPGIEVKSVLSADYSYEPPAVFGAVGPGLLADAAGDNNLPISGAQLGTGCFLPGSGCIPGPSPTPTTTPTATDTPPPTSTPTQSSTPTTTSTPTSTALPTLTDTPANTPTNTPTPTPLVYPIKLAFPQNIPPGNTTLAFDIIVINYGNPTGASLTEVIDRLPAGMSYRPGTCNPVSCVISGGNRVITWDFSPGIVIAQGSFYRLSFQANVAGTLPGDVLVNEVETQGDNFETSVNWRRVYVYTPTPTPTATVIPVASADSAVTDEDNSVDIDVLANDNGLRDAPFTVSVIAGPSSGSTLVLGSPGPASGIRIRYTPNANFFGTDTFTYRVTDGDGQSGTALVTVNVNSVDDFPAASPDSVTVNEDTLISINVLANDGGIGDPAFTVAVISPPSHGTASVIGSPGPASGIRIQYQGFSNYYGPDGFTYRVTDADGDSSSAGVSITVNAVNDAPVAVDDTGYSVDEDASLDISSTGDPYVVANDTDVDGPFPLQAVFRTNPFNGTLTLNPDGSFIYTPNPNFFGTDSFTYRARDAASLLSTNFGTVTITVNGQDDTPVAIDDFISTDEDIPVALNVLANDTTVVDLPVTVTILSGPSNGVLTPAGPLVANSFPPTASFTYTPDPDWSGTDNYVYEACDADVIPECTTATVTVTVNPVPDPPLAADDSATTQEDVNVIIPVLTNDAPGDSPIDVSTVTIVSPPMNGTIASINPGNGNVEYEPDPDYFGGDSFSYTVDDLAGFTSNIANVSITITAEDDIPQAINDIDYALVGETIYINVLGNDLGIGDIPLAVSIESYPPTSCPTGTCVSVTPSNRIQYTPDIAVAMGSGSETFSYQVTDINGQPSTANITVYINDPPTANDDDIVTNEDTPILIDVLADNGHGADTDLDDALDPASVHITHGPSNGSVTNHHDGTVTYDPDLDFESPPIDCFDYTVNDTYLPVPATSNVASVCVTVVGVNDVPVANDDSGFAQEDGNDVIDVLANDFDVDGTLDPSTVAIVPGFGPSNGTTSVNSSTGEITYTPNSGFYGTDSFRYTVDDDLGATSNQATVTVDVNARPIAVDDSMTANEDVSAIFNVLSNDSDPDDPPASLFISGTTPASHGTVANNGTSISYNPAPDYNGPDLFSYTLADGRGGFDTAIVNVTVNPANDIPVAYDDPGVGGPAIVTDEDTPITINVLANDLGLGDTPLIVTVTSGPGNGSTTVLGNLSIEFTPDPDWSGGDSFVYQVCDKDGLPDCDSATVTLTVNSVNDPPVAQNDTASTTEDLAVDIDVLANDDDPVEGDLPLTVVAVTQPPNGTVTNHGSYVTYDPDPNFTGVDTFSYTAHDTGGASASANVSVTVSSIPDPPVAANDSVSTNQATPITINVAANDTDPDGDLDPTSVSLIGLPANGIAVNNFNGTVTYTPNPGAFTADSFTYEISDLTGLTSNTATVTVHINPPNLQVAKDANPSAANLGDTIFYFIYVWNDGPGIAYGVNLTDSLGSCFSWTTGNPSGLIGDLAEGEAVVRLAQARVTSTGSCGSDNTASVTSVNGASDSDTASVCLPPNVCGGAAPLGGAGGGSGMSAAVESPTPTPTPTDTPVSMFMGAGPMSASSPLLLAAPPTETSIPTPTATLDPGLAVSTTSTSTPTPGSIASSTPVGSTTAVPTGTPGSQTDTPAATALSSTATGSSLSGATATLVPSVGPAGFTTTPTINPTVGSSGSLPTPTAVPNPTPTATAPSGNLAPITEAMFTFLIPVLMIVMPLLINLVARLRYPKPR
jgi:hypothetical protein